LFHKDEGWWAYGPGCGQIFAPPPIDRNFAELVSEGAESNESQVQAVAGCHRRGNVPRVLYLLWV